MNTIDRRDFFKIGALTALGALSLDDLVQSQEAEAATATGASKAKHWAFEIDPGAVHRLDGDSRKVSSLPLMFSSKSQSSAALLVTPFVPEWKGTINAGLLIKNIYADRSLSTRPEPRL